MGVGQTVILLIPGNWLVGIGPLELTLTRGLYLVFRADRHENRTGFFLSGRRTRRPVVGASIFTINIGVEHWRRALGPTFRKLLSLVWKVSGWLL